MRRRAFHPLMRIALGVTAITAVTAHGDARADQSNDAAAAEALVTQLYFEGLPYSEARVLTPAGSARLVAMLNDPASVRFHANIVLALGIAGHPGCVEALIDFAAPGPDDASLPRTSALYMVPLAMGYAAHRDDRALGWLLARAADPAYPQQMSAITGLALAARPEADVALRELLETVADGAAASARQDPTAQHVAASLDYSARLQRDGYEALLGGTR